MTGDDRLAAAIDHLAEAIGQLATAIATPPADAPADEPCIRCGGRGYLGHRVNPCHVCAGDGRTPRT